jgi:hypothetical protein
MISFSSFSWSFPISNSLWHYSGAVGSPATAGFTSYLGTSYILLNCYSERIPRSLSEHCGPVRRNCGGDPALTELQGASMCVTGACRRLCHTCNAQDSCKNSGFKVRKLKEKGALRDGHICQTGGTRQGRAEGGVPISRRTRDEPSNKLIRNTACCCLLLSPPVDMFDSFAALVLFYARPIQFSLN